MISKDKVKEINAKVETEMKWFKKNGKGLLAWFDRSEPNAALFDQQTQ